MHASGKTDTKGEYDAKYYGNSIYLAPEVIENKEKFDKVKADVFSAGILLYRMIFGQHPFDKENAWLENPKYKAAIGNPDKFWGWDVEEEDQ